MRAQHEALARLERFWQARTEARQFVDLVPPFLRREPPTGVSAEDNCYPAVAAAYEHHNKSVQPFVQRVLPDNCGEASFHPRSRVLPAGTPLGDRVREYAQALIAAPRTRVFVPGSGTSPAVQWPVCVMATSQFLLACTVLEEPLAMDAAAALTSILVRWHPDSVLGCRLWSNVAVWALCAVQNCMASSDGRLDAILLNLRQGMAVAALRECELLVTDVYAACRQHLQGDGTGSTPALRETRRLLARVSRDAARLRGEAEPGAGAGLMVEAPAAGFDPHRLTSDVIEVLTALDQASRSTAPASARELRELSPRVANVLEWDEYLDRMALCMLAQAGIELSRSAAVGRSDADAVAKVLSDPALEDPATGRPFPCAVHEHELVLEYAPCSEAVRPDRWSRLCRWRIPRT